ncbi:hypothetical protein CERZMDRAFT_90540 [Cercospora zeae-maydis SCOH1-5]|uniref:Uncharacterized protein n=1 Tax=Cercospora zeae-maydis SCOH1-5 TaxID=717836 RepID=A0A6A6FI22_9PEZI|nr:hypothetical protein CERZMDRAFT_90540 [Cercospora zeae-maydis SCOH1-5]
MQLSVRSSHRLHAVNYADHVIQRSTISKQQPLVECTSSQLNATTPTICASDLYTIAFSRQLHL